jgi:hypothetical protein
MSIFSVTVIGDVNATTVSNEDNDQTKNDEDMFKLKVKLNLNNIDPNVQKIKLVSFVNGEVKEQYVDLLQEKSKIQNNILRIDLQFAKSNDVSSIVATDQYFVCGYAINHNNIQNQLTTISHNSQISLYDCDEGNIGSSDSSTAHLFNTLNKFNESFYYNTSNVGKGNPVAKEVKINVKVPLEDAIDDVDKISVVGMVGGQYKVETIDAKESLEKQGEKILEVPFVFNRQSETGLVQLGDKFFGCVAGEELSPQHTHCEKRMIKDFEKGNELYSRKDNNFK